MLHIKYGSIFDEKCDLLVLPCDSGGGVTNWVRQEIKGNNLPFPNQHVPYGNVIFSETNSKYKKCDYVGFAASVDAKTTTSDTGSIRKILVETIKYAEENFCSIINLPVLGTGAGGLSYEQVIEIYREVLGKSKSTINVYIPDLQLSKIFNGSSEDKAASIIDFENPRVFISYSWNDDAIKSWVYDLAHKLCENGVDARLDRFHLKPGMDMPQWMTNEIIKADKVLLVCDSYYAEKADMRKAGVGWETMLIQGDILLQGDMNTKYISIACGDFNKNIPIYMKSKLGIKKEDVDNCFEVLLEQIFDIDLAPVVGSIPDWVKKKLNKRANQVAGGL
ncbi:SEFIR domain-containing protein [Shewanella baltica]|uniref:SEFIR domain-containing protein n=1 Tax=Shewanella baltica TaxID=62322 RepID=UPI00217DA33B|nr:TIR domain-containing protein [Shewanella baltica]MCS6159234.1 TIR domain-containing protein [Shewanella baltica]